MNNLKQVKRFIFTGTPGSGKTSVIEMLEKLGHIVIHESVTDLIDEELAKNNMRPWEQTNFVDKIIQMQKVRQSKAEGEIQFYDRSPFCTYALGKYLSRWNKSNLIPSPVLSKSIDQCLKTEFYQNKVFFFENLGFVEHTDAYKISYENALIFEQIHLDVYKAFGFDMIMIPNKSIGERCKFILKNIANNTELQFNATQHA